MKADKTARTRDLFLFWIGAVYMFAFGSIYTQIPGLFGNKGILPVTSLLNSVKEESQAKTTEELYMHTPTLIWFLPFNFDIGLEFIALLGTFVSFLTLFSRRVRVAPVFLVQWLLYLSLYKVGETFLWFQWDILLLEVGFLCVLIAPLCSNDSDAETGVNLHRQIPFWLVRWLLFRLMFASGIVKLTSNCPTWWKLTALNFHYESQCIPTPLAWWAHQLPSWFQQMSVLATYVIEIVVPFLFFSPLRFSRLLAGYSQVFLMVVIALTGNYNFFNLLTAVLCLSLADDDHIAFLTRGFLWKSSDEPKVPNAKGQGSCVKKCSNLAVLGAIAFICYQLSSYDEFFKLEFTSEDLNAFLKTSLPLITWGAVALFACKVFFIVYNSMDRSIVKVVLVLLPALYVFSISLVPFSTLESGYSGDLWPIVKRWHAASNRFELVHSYGLFRRMTGVGGRPEVIIEGSNSPDGPWKEYEFVYKPGNSKNPLRWTGPHQPRLDWQLWFAALGSYQHNPWFVSLIHRLLIGQPDVLDLLDTSRLPFGSSRPKYVRSRLYKYNYSRLKKDGSVPVAWWKRKFEKEYTPPLTDTETHMLEFLKYNKLLPVEIKRKAPPGRVENAIVALRAYLKQISPPVLLWSLFFTALTLSIITGRLFGASQRKEKAE